MIAEAERVTVTDAPPRRGPNPNWIAYCRAQGRSPEDQLAHDRKQWPGGSMTGLILWVMGGKPDRSTPPPNPVD